MPNIKSVIQNCNLNLLSKYTTPVAVCSCSYHKNSECLLDNECLSEGFILKTAASQIPSQISKYDDGTCAKTFKEQYNNHTIIILLHLETTPNRKVLTSLNTSGKNNIGKTK